MRVGVEPKSRDCEHGRRKNGAFNPLGHAADYLYAILIKFMVLLLRLICILSL